MRDVDIIRIKAVNGQYHAVEEEGTDSILHTADKQSEAQAWAIMNGRKIRSIHRERNMKPGDRHGQYRHF